MSSRHILAAVIGVAGLLTASSPSWSQPAAKSAAAAAAPVVKVRQGQLNGAQAGEVASYLGIPYAAPPVGDLRWRAPKAAANWSGARDATKPGATCFAAEDCLFLNVYKPASANAGAKLPVMVWIHGGSFTGGSGMNGFGANHDGTEFAKKGVVTVTINYRLGRAGWFAHPALTREAGAEPTANFGNMDQIAALKWVQANIAAFGGDPKNVTVFGESAGGISVSYLMLAPQARGLFAKAIQESGFGRSTPATLAVAEGYGKRVSDLNNIKGDGPDAAAALRKLPIIGPAGDKAFPPSSGRSDVTRPYPIIDGRLIKETVAEGFAKGHEAKVPYIAGGNSNEASLYRPAANDLDAITDRREVLMAAFDPGRKGNKLQIINDLVTVQRITEPDRNLARKHTANGAPTWNYYFSYLTPAQRATSLGAGHVAEIKYVFNGPGQNTLPEDWATGASMNAYWAAFAKYGDPGAAGGPAWPKYDPSKEAVLEFSNEGPRVRAHLLKAQLDYVEQGLAK
ncbi:MAG: carboxylesterase type [Caulobacteraceae bacterium]|nr:carboxylesterase type [Caulobacteraceae bacterium]